MNRDFKLNEPPVACKFPLDHLLFAFGRRSIDNNWKSEAEDHEGSF